MKITTDLKKNHSLLSKTNVQFLEYVEANPDCLDAANFGLLELGEGIFKLQCWPTFIGQKIKKDIEEAGVCLFELFRSIPQRVFGGDYHKMSTFYNVPVEDIHKQLDGYTTSDIANLMGRGDFILSSSGFKCLEYNVFSSLGGWQVPMWESLYLNLPIITDFLEQNNVKPVEKNLLSELLHHYIQHAINDYTDNIDTINCALVVYQKDIVDVSLQRTVIHLNQLYKKQLARFNKRLNGSIFCCHFGEIDIHDNRLYYDQQEIKVLIEVQMGYTPDEIMKAFKKNHFHLYNGPVSLILSSKLNLALLSDSENSGIFNSKEKEIIKKYIPWSRKIVPGNTTYKTGEIELIQFIRENKIHLIIKPSEGYGGEGVFIGPLTSQEKWDAAVDQALVNKNWLVQEYVEAIPYLYQAGDNGCTLHDAVWGFFVFGSKYAGEWIRVMPRDGGKGIINCHQGATVSVVFEVDEE